MDFETWVDTHFANSSMDLDKLKKAYEDALSGAGSYERQIAQLKEEVNSLRLKIEKD